MVNVLAHELAECASDPFGNAWQATVWDWRLLDYVQKEAADLCVWDYGTNKRTGTDRGGKVYLYNMVGNARMRFLVQQVWEPVRNKRRNQVFL